MSKLSCLVLITVVGLLSVEADDESRSHGGQNAVNGQLSHNFHIRSIDRVSTAITCGGSIIGDHFVLMGVGCFITFPDDDIKKLRVVAGDIDLRNNGSQYHIAKILRNSPWDDKNSRTKFERFNYQPKIYQLEMMAPRCQQF